MGHPSSFRVAVFIPPGRCTKKNFHASHRAPNDIHCKPQHVTKRTVQRTLVILSIFKADNILVVLLFQLLHQNIPFSPFAAGTIITWLLLRFKCYFLLLTLSQFFNISHRPWKLELFLKCFPGLQSSRHNILAFPDWKHQVSSAR